MQIKSSENEAWNDWSQNKIADLCEMAFSNAIDWMKFYSKLSDVCFLWLSYQ